MHSVDPDQMMHSAVSDLSLHCLPITLLGVPRLNRFNFQHFLQTIPDDLCDLDQVLWEAASIKCSYIHMNYAELYQKKQRLLVTLKQTLTAEQIDIEIDRKTKIEYLLTYFKSQGYKNTRKVGHVYPRPALPPVFKEHKVCSFDSGDGSYMLYVITLKNFNHT